MRAAPPGAHPGGAAPHHASDGPGTAGHALVAAYDVRLVALVSEALQQVAPRLATRVVDGTAGIGALLVSLRPELALIDLNLVEYSSREFVAQARAANADARVVVIAGHGDDDRVLPALRAGAAGFLVKHDALPDALPAVCAQLRTVLAGALPVTAGLARQLLRQLGWTGLARSLSTVELEILNWLSLGDTPAEVGERMRLDRAAMRRHLDHVFEVLQLPGTAGTDL